MRSTLFIPVLGGIPMPTDETEKNHVERLKSGIINEIEKISEGSFTRSITENNDLIFYQKESANPEDLIDLYNKIYQHAHNSAYLYQKRKLCKCNICESASKITLSFITVIGRFNLIDIKGKKRPHGTDVVLATKLLSNKIDEREYILLTDAEGDDILGHSQTFKGLPVFTGRIDLKELGNTNFQYLILNKWKFKPESTSVEEIQEIDKEKLVKRIDSSKSHKEIYQTITDLNQRTKWEQLLNNLDIPSHELNEVGLQFKAQIFSKNYTIEVGAPKSNGRKDLVYIEKIIDSSSKPISTLKYAIKPKNDSGCEVEVSLDIDNETFVKGIPGLFKRKKIGGLLQKSLNLLA